MRTSRRWGLFLLGMMLVFWSTHNAQSQVVGYAVRSNIDGRFHQVNLTTGTTTSFALVGFFSEGIGFDPNQQLFGVVQGIPGTFISINQTTGVGTSVGSTGVFTDENGFAFDSTGNGFMTSADGNFYRINPTTGTATLIGPTGLGAGVEGLTWRNGVFYGVTAANLVTINGITGAGTVVGALGAVSGNDSGIDFDSSGTLWGLNSAGQIFTIDPTTGAATIVAATIAGFENLAIVFLAPSSSQTFFTARATTPNQTGVARVIDDAIRAGDIRINPLLAALNALPAGSIPGALEQLVPDEFDALTRVIGAGVRLQGGLLGNRMTELRHGASGLSLASLNLDGPDGRVKFDPRYLLADTGDSVVLGAPTAALFQPDQRWGFFAAGNGQFGDVSGSALASGYEFDAGGLTLGADYKLNDHCVVGAYSGYSGVEAEVDANGGDIHSDSIRFGMFATAWTDSGTYVEGTLGGGYNSYDTRRSVLGATASGNTDGTGFDSSLALGHAWKMDRWKMGPRAALSYSWVGVNDFTETGSVGPLAIQSMDNHSLQSHLGWQVSYEADWKGIKIYPGVGLGWKHEFLDLDQAVDARFASGAGEIFRVRGREIGAESGTAQCSLTIGWTDTISTSLSYETEANESLLYSSVNASVRVIF